MFRTVRFAAGEREGASDCIRISIFNDNEEEDPETFRLFMIILGDSIQNVQVAPERRTKLVTIIDGKYRM